MSSEWTVGVCGCLTDTNTCLDHLFCIPCMMSRQIRAIGTRGMRDTFSGPVCFGVCLMCPLYLLVTRRNLVNWYGIDEGCCNSLCKCCLCGPLLTCQNHYELTARGMWPGSTLCATEPPQISLHDDDDIQKETKKREESPAEEEDPAPQGRIQQQEELPQHSDTSPQGQIPTPRQHDTTRIPYGPPAVTHPPYDQGTSTGMTYQV